MSQVVCAGTYRGGQRGHNVRGTKSLGAPKSPNNVASTFSNTVHLLPKDLSFEHRGAELVSWPGRHLTSLRPRVCGRIFPLSMCPGWRDYLRSRGYFCTGVKSIAVPREKLSLAPAHWLTRSCTNFRTFSTRVGTGPARLPMFVVRARTLYHMAGT